MRSSIAIVGAGVAGLSAGCYAQMNGYRSCIFEMGSRPGGVCTAWRRDGYTIDACIHWLVGSSAESSLHRLWEEVGVAGSQPIHDSEVFLRVEGEDGRALTVYTDIERLSRHLLELAPEDRDPILEWTRDLHRLARLDAPIERPADGGGPLRRLTAASRRLPYVGVLRRWRGVTVRQFAEDLDNPFLREALPLVFALPDFPMFAMMMTLARMHSRVAGYPIGGSEPFVHAIERRYLDLGGSVQYGARVEEILVEENRAVGVRLADGSEPRFNAVISAADGHATVFELLRGRYCSDALRRYYDHLPVSPPFLLVGIGVKRVPDGFPDALQGISFPLSEPIVVDGRRLARLSVRASVFDPTLAPEGGAVMQVVIPSSFERWQALRAEPDAYRAEKDAVAAEVLRGLEERFPGLSSDVEVVDVATPATWHRITGTWRGSPAGWLPSPRTLSIRLKKTLPGLYDCYMVGQWVEPGGGLPSVVMSARQVLERICKEDEKRFRVASTHAEAGG